MPSFHVFFFSRSYLLSDCPFLIFTCFTDQTDALSQSKHSEQDFFVGVGAERGGCLYLYHSRIDRSWFGLKLYLRHCDNCQEKMFFCRKWIFTHYIIEMAFLAMHFLHWHCSPCFPFISDQAVRNLQVSFIFSLQIRFLFSYVLLICKINSLSKSRRWLRYWWKNSFKV